MLSKNIILIILFMFKNNILILTCLLASPVYADIATDGTLGNKMHLTGPDYHIDQTMGQIAGQNLFHSFDHFALTEQETATFSSNQPINNVISRVTGGQRSVIDGKMISTIPNADFYFLNPAGLLFGENAKLDIPGALHITTADTLHFSDGHEFNARYPHKNSHLSTASPTAFGFLTPSPAAININSKKFYLSEEKTLSIIGGDIILDKANIRARSGRINIAAVAGKGLVIPMSEDLTMTTPSGNLTVKNTSWIMSSAKTNSQKVSGDIYIRGGEYILQDSNIRADTYGAEQGGTIDIRANNFIMMDNSYLVNYVYGTGNGGNINISADDLSVKNGAMINGSTYGLGKGSHIDIDVKNAVLLNGESSDIGADSYGEGKGGTITIKATQLNVQNGAQIGATANATGYGGNIIIQLSKDALFSGTNHDKSYPSGILVGSYDEKDNAGEAGQFTLTAKRLILENGAKIATQTYNADGGDIHIDLGSYLYLQEGELTSSVKNSVGDGGKIILTSQFIALDNSTILAEAEEGKGGTIYIDALDIFGLYPFSSSTISAQSKSGEDGTVTISSPDTNIMQGLVILPTAFLDNELLQPACENPTRSKSSFTVNTYSGSPTLPIDWQGSHLLPNE